MEKCAESNHRRSNSWPLDVSDTSTTIQPTAGQQEKGGQAPLLYPLNSKPPVYMALLFGFQQAVLAVGGSLSAALIVAKLICADSDEVFKLQLFSSTILVAGLSTFFQCALGTRLPLVQGTSSTFIPPIIALMTLEELRCPGPMYRPIDLTGNVPPNATGNFNSTHDLILPTDAWRSRILQFQGGLMMASLIQVLIGSVGFVGFILRFIGPITILPCVSLVGLSLTGLCNIFCSVHWGIAIVSMLVILICILYINNAKPPLPTYSKGKGCHVMSGPPIFTLYPLIFCLVITWILCAILTVTNVLPSDPAEKAYLARIDAKVDIIKQAQYVNFPYPGQWGTPTFSAAAFAGMLTAVIAGIIESVGDYYAAARACKVEMPPAHAVNRGVLIEGFGCFLGAAIGGTLGVTTYSGNIGMISVTQVGSRRAFYCAALFMCLCGLLPKLGALMTSLPDPLVGGMITISLAMVVSIGVANAQYINLNSSRNLIILGMSLLLGLQVPQWMADNPGAIKTGSRTLDSVIEVLLAISTFVGGLVAFILDNTVPGSPEERGLLHWLSKPQHSTATDQTYDPPFFTSFFHGHAWARYIPFLPTFHPSFPNCLPCKRTHKNEHSEQPSDNTQTTHV